MSGETTSSDSPRAACSVDVFVVAVFAGSTSESAWKSGAAAVTHGVNDETAVNGEAVSSGSQGTRSQGTRSRGTRLQGTEPVAPSADIYRCVDGSVDVSAAAIHANALHDRAYTAPSAQRSAGTHGDTESVVTVGEVIVRNIGAHVTTLVSKRASMAGRASRKTASPKTASPRTASPQTVAPRAGARRAFNRTMNVTRRVTMTNVDAAAAVVDAAGVLDVPVPGPVTFSSTHRPYGARAHSLAVSCFYVSQVRAPKARESAPSVLATAVPWTAVTEQKVASFGLFHMGLPSGSRGVSAVVEMTRGGMLVDRTSVVQAPGGNVPFDGRAQHRTRQLARLVRSGELSSPFCGIVSR
jgi:hypothetical protein